MTKLAARMLAAASLCAVMAARAAVPLPSYNVDPTQATVSGVSAGGFMAGQLGYAYSSYFKGVGVFAAGPYLCAGRDHYTGCMYNAGIGSARLAAMQAGIDGLSASGAIDPKTNVAGQKVYLFVGGTDTTVGSNPVAAARTQYVDNGVAAANLEFVQRASTAHVFPTDFDAAGNNPCSSSVPPFIANCGYDGARAVLTKFYGPLNPRNDAPGAGNYIEFDQRAFTANTGMAATGWLYVPANCAAGARCRLHVVLHGCQQSHAHVGDKFIRNTGYTRWADTNSIIVLFPQGKADAVAAPTPASGWLPNPHGCFDWVGWYGGNFAERGGVQVAAIKAMVDRLSSGPASACTTDSNYGHTRAGRARAFWFLTYANGSNQSMGWWNAFVHSTLKQTGPNHYVVGGC